MADTFYVEAECCLFCGVPESVAPELFGWRDNACFVRRQPQSQAETDKMIEAMWSGEADCIRYRGDDAIILKRLGEAGMAALADNPRARDFPALRRDRVVFSLQPGDPHDASPKALADAFRSFLRGKSRHKIAPAIFRRHRVSFSWYLPKFHSVSFEGRRADGRQAAVLYPSWESALQGLARIVDDWLRNSADAAEIAWHTRESEMAGTEGYPLPL